MPTGLRDRSPDGRPVSGPTGGRGNDGHSPAQRSASAGGLGLSPGDSQQEATPRAAWDTGGQEDGSRKGRVIRQLHEQNDELRQAVTLVSQQLDVLVKKSGSQPDRDGADTKLQRWQQQRMRTLAVENASLLHEQHVLMRRTKGVRAKSRLEQKAIRLQGLASRYQEQCGHLKQQNRDNSKKLAEFANPESYRLFVARQLKEEAKVLRANLERTQKTHDQTRSHVDFQKRRLEQLKRDDTCPHLSAADVRRCTELSVALHERNEELEGLRYRLEVLQRQNGAAKRIGDAQRMAQDKEALIALRKESSLLRQALGMTPDQPVHPTPVSQPKRRPPPPAAKPKAPPPPDSDSEETPAPAVMPPAKRPVPVPAAASAESSPRNKPPSPAKVESPTFLTQDDGPASRPSSVSYSADFSGGAEEERKQAEEEAAAKRAEEERQRKEEEDRIAAEIREKYREQCEEQIREQGHEEAVQRAVLKADEQRIWDSFGEEREID